MAKGGLFGDIISGIQKSMGGKKKSEKKPDLDEGQDGGSDGDEDEEEDEDLVDATEVIKSLADNVEDLTAAVKKLVEHNEQDAEFKKSMGDGMIGLLNGFEQIAGTPLPRKGANALDAAAMNKGGLGGNASSTAIRHRRFTPQDKDDAMEILSKAVANKELDILECGKIESQINKSIRDPNFQLDQKYISFLAKKEQGK
jgi:hypothetical protein